MNVDPDDLVMDTVIGDEWRWVITVVAAYCLVTMLRLFVRKRRAGGKSFAESMSILGGAFVCGSVGLAALGLIFNWDSLWRLPFLAAALVYVAVGRTIELHQLKKRK